MAVSGGRPQRGLFLGNSSHTSIPHDRLLSRAQPRRYAASGIAALREELPSPKLLAAWATLVLALGVLSAFAAAFDRFPWDLTLARAVQAIDLLGFRRTSWVATYLSSPTISQLGLATAVGALLLLRRPRLAFFAAASAWTHLLGGLLKVLVDRPRPSGELVDVVRIETKFSYPSGHAEWVMGFEGFLVFAIWQLTRNRLTRAVSLGLWGLHLLFVGLGRVEQGLHWPSDVLAGYLVGAIAVAVTIWAYRVSRHIRFGQVDAEHVAGP